MTRAPRTLFFAFAGKKYSPFFLRLSFFDAPPGAQGGRAVRGRRPKAKT